MTKNKEKYLLVVSFLEARNFVHRKKTQFVIEAKFDNEQLSSDPVEHDETIEINQELAWELDKKALQQHRLQRSVIKVNCFAVGESFKENIGYIVLDIRSASEGTERKPKWCQLLQSKYPKSKPEIQYNIYIEEDKNPPSQQKEETPIQSARLPPRPNSASSSHNDNGNLKVSLIDNEGYFLIGKQTNECHTFLLTITIGFARNLIRLIANSDAQPKTNFFFTYSFLNNQVATRPFDDIVSCQINGERSSIRLHSTFESLELFFKQQNELEILLCSNDKIIGKTKLNWKDVLEKLNENNFLNNKSNSENPVLVDELLKFEPIISGPGRTSPMVDINMSPVIGIQIGLMKENLTQSEVQVIDNIIGEQVSKGIVVNSDESIRKSPTPQQKQQFGPTNSSSRLTMNANMDPKPSQNDASSLITQEMQLRAAYELQVWKEQKEKEFEQHLKKLEAKKFQELAEAFKQHDIERELLVQKKIKEYTDLENVLKKSINEVEKREKQLALNEAHVARIKADLHHEYETKLIELREASKRVQERADHQVSLQKEKCVSLEEEIGRYKKQIIEWEKKYADKEVEFSKYKERENHRPEVRLQSEINVLNLEKIELERKLEAMSKAKNHYKEQWSRALQEIAAIKKREEANAKSMLQKQQRELEHLRLRYLAAEENELLKTDEKQLSSLKNELEKMRIMNSHRSTSEMDLRTFSASNNSDELNLDMNLKEQISRLMEEKETLLRTGVYSNADAIIVELDKRINNCLKEARQIN